MNMNYDVVVRTTNTSCPLGNDIVSPRSFSLKTLIKIVLGVLFFFFEGEMKLRKLD